MGPPDPKDMAADVARDLTSLASDRTRAKGVANHWLKEHEYATSAEFTKAYVSLEESTGGWMTKHVNLNVYLGSDASPMVSVSGSPGNFALTDFSQIPLQRTLHSPDPTPKAVVNAVGPSLRCLLSSIAREASDRADTPIPHRRRSSEVQYTAQRYMSLLDSDLLLRGII
jgi:hypothetical protein